MDLVVQPSEASERLIENLAPNAQGNRTLMRQRYFAQFAAKPE